MTKLSVFSLAVSCLLMLNGCKKEKPPVPDTTTEPNAPTWVIYNTGNSKLPDNQVNALAIDQHDVKWVGTANGLARVDKDAWTIFTKTNSALPSDYIQALTVGGDGRIWVGTDKGLSVYNGQVWTTYTTANSPMSSDGIMCIRRDDTRDRTWIATDNELLLFTSGNQWQRFDDVDDLILSMAVDDDGSLWLGMFNHFAFKGRIRKLLNGQWTTYQLDQMGYPSSFPYGIALDRAHSPVAVLSGTSVKAVIRLKGRAVGRSNAPRAGIRAEDIADQRRRDLGSRKRLFGIWRPEIAGHQDP